MGQLIDNAEANYLLGQNVMQSVDKAIVATFQHALDKNKGCFGMLVKQGEKGPKIEFFSPDSASDEIKVFCEKVAAMGNITATRKTQIFQEQLEAYFEELGPFTLTCTDDAQKIEAILK
jgi:hypothetical protein